MPEACGIIQTILFEKFTTQQLSENPPELQHPRHAQTCSGYRSQRKNHLRLKQNPEDGLSQHGRGIQSTRGPHRGL